MNKLLLPVLLLAFSINNFAQQNYNINLLGHLEYDEDLSDVWGMNYNGKEYALVGLYSGLSIVDVTDPTNPTEVQFVQGSQSIWRDVKRWNNYIYNINENSGGLQIINIDDFSVTNWTGDGTTNFVEAHNLFIDENGIGYIIAPNLGFGERGVLMIDLNNSPTNPTILGLYNDAYVHDAYVRGDTLYTAEIYEGQFSIIDISDKTNLQILGQQSTPSNFTHNIWLSDDGKKVYTTDERSGAYIAQYDVSDPTDIDEVNRYRVDYNNDIIPHNTFFKDGKLYNSYYTAGITVNDVSFEDQMTEVGQYVTDGELENFNGVWGIYPYLTSGNILATDINKGLYIFGDETKKASYFEVIVTNYDNQTIKGAEICIETPIKTYCFIADADGFVRGGIPVEGDFIIIASNDTCLTSIPQSFNFQSASKTNIEIQLCCDNSTEPICLNSAENYIEISNSNGLLIQYNFIPEINNAELLIYDAAGRLITKYDLENNFGFIRPDFQFAKGVYFAHLINDRKRISTKKFYQNL